MGKGSVSQTAPPFKPVVMGSRKVQRPVMMGHPTLMLSLAFAEQTAKEGGSSYNGGAGAGQGVWNRLYLAGGAEAEWRESLRRS